MFGLMRASKCGMSAEEKNVLRLNYCGTCKTIGAIYGQKSRFLLDYDAVFLAEILTALSGEAAYDWEKSYQSYNCLNLPKSEMPLALQFAATTNVILTGFKLADHVSDEGKSRFRFAQKAFSAEFRQAESLLKTWNFPLEKVKEILQTQDERESKNSLLKDLAEPTALTTAEFFARGAELVGKSDLKDLMFEIGFAFGEAVYLLDAFEDYEKDFHKNQFNALRSVYHLKESKMSAATRRKAAAILHETVSEIAAKIYELPISENQKTLFARRLEINLQKRLEINLPVLKTKRICSPKPKQTVAQRIGAAKAKAKVLSGSFAWQAPLVFLFVFAFALIAPAQSREAKSARDCFDYGFNLMFLGSVLTVPLAAVQNLSFAQISGENEKKRGSCWDYCDCCDCDCCCCCGDGFCDGCDCCGCDC